MVDIGPRLFDWLPAGSHSTPEPRLRAHLMHVDPGVIDLQAIAAPDDCWIGLLILDGLLLVELDAGRAHTGWLMGADDIICPWDMGEISLAGLAVWRALTPVRIALLDREFSLRAGGIPVLARTLVKKTAHTTNWLLAKSLVMASPHVEERILLVFALLGERWGTVNHEGVRLKLPLTHAQLATLCGVRRPSVTLALRSLTVAGFLSRADDGAWLLHRRCPEELKSAPACWSQYSDALGLGEVAAGSGAA